ncbi:Snf7 family protein [Tardisphaera miroshnichenkoae]
MSIKNWEKEYDVGIVKRAVMKVHPGMPLKERINHIIYRLNTQKQILEQTAYKMEQRDKEFFEKVTEALINKDEARAKMYANECAEVRKMAKVVLRSQLALEQVALRLETIEEFGDVAVSMAPLAQVVGSIRGELSGVMPTVSFELGEINETLGQLVTEAGEASGASYDVEASEEARKILDEAGAVAEQKIKERFPEAPTLGAAEADKEAK